MKDLQRSRPSLQAETGRQSPTEERTYAAFEQVNYMPVFPAIVTQILPMAQDPEVHVQEIVRLVKCDPCLTSNVLQLANSAYFAGTHPVGSLQEAIVRLGLKRFLDFVMFTVITPLAKRPVAGYDLEAGQLLAHSAAVAVGVESIALELGEATPEYGFTAGLLHDIGKIILGTCMDVDSKAIVKMAFRDGFAFEEAEKRILGFNHPEAGAFLLQHWHLPEDMIASVKYHHAPDDAPQKLPLIDLVHVADQLALRSGIGAGVDGLHYRSSAPTICRVSLKEAAAERVLCRMLNGVWDIQHLVTMNVL